MSGVDRRRGIQESGDALKFQIGIWRRNSDTINVTGQNGVVLWTTVSNNPASVRYHPNLYKKLDAILKEMGR